MKKSFVWTIFACLTAVTVHSQTQSQSVIGSESSSVVQSEKPSGGISVTKPTAEIKTSATAPQYTLVGTVVDKLRQTPVPFASILVYQTTRGTTSDADGRFLLGPLSPGLYTVQVSSVGFQTTLLTDIKLFTSNQSVRIELEEVPTEIAAVSVFGAGSFRKSTESPTSLRTIGIKEIEQNPGANRDISRVLTSFPGVATPSGAFRNDLFVRGGGPAENRFYVDGIEIPNINHFSTQGASGGPVGLLNADLIREVDFYSGAFPMAKPTKLSALLDIKLQDGNSENAIVELGVGASEASVSAQGPLSANTTYLFSLRRSYLQFLFKALDLPFLPTYTDALLKIKTRLNSKHEMNFLYVGAWDDMKLNTSLDTTAGTDGYTDQQTYNAYLLGNLPRIQQHTFTYGMQYKYYARRSTHTFTLSHNYLRNRNNKFIDNVEREENRLLKIDSEEREAHARYESRWELGTLDSYTARLVWGAHLDYGNFTMDSYLKTARSDSETIPAAITYQTDLSVWKWGGHVGIHLESADRRLRAFAGLQSEASPYNRHMRSLTNQLSPRASVSYRLFKWLHRQAEQTIHWNSAVGRYYQLPAYTMLGFKQEMNGGDPLINRNRLKYIGSDQFSTGLEWRTQSIQVTAEVFYKNYFDSPLSLQDSIPMAGKGDDYGITGNEAVSSQAEGKAYGIELMARWQNRQYGSLSASYTWSHSTYEGIASAWDFRQIGSFAGILNLPESVFFGNHWTMGVKFRLVGGTPYTPYDEANSSLAARWDVTGKPVLDYSKYNTLRQDIFTQLDVRLDKTFYRPGWMFRCYIDIQNVLAASYKTPPLYLSTGRRNAQDPSRYEMRYLQRSSENVFPTVGLMVEF